MSRKRRLRPLYRLSLRFSTISLTLAAAETSSADPAGSAAAAAAADDDDDDGADLS
jgi:hypothetical protein